MNLRNNDLYYTRQMLRNQELKIELARAAGIFAIRRRYKGNIFIQTDLLRRWITA